MKKTTELTPESFAQMKILGQNWDVVWTPSWIIPGQYGHCDPDNQAIVIRHGLRGQQCADTLLHETIHAVENILGLDMTEAQVRLLATGLTQVFQDNPEYYGVLAECYHHEDQRGK